MMKADGFGGCFGGCFFVRASRTVSAFQGSTRLLSFSGLPFLSLSVSLKTAFTLPCIISLANLLAVSCVGCWPLWCTRVEFFWIVRDLLIRSSRFPWDQSFRRRYRWVRSSFSLDL